MLSCSSSLPMLDASDGRRKRRPCDPAARSASPTLAGAAGACNDRTSRLSVQPDRSRSATGPLSQSADRRPNCRRSAGPNRERPTTATMTIRAMIKRVLDQVLAFFACEPVLEVEIQSQHGFLPSGPCPKCGGWMDRPIGRVGWLPAGACELGLRSAEYCQIATSFARPSPIRAVPGQVNKIPIGACASAPPWSRRMPGCRRRRCATFRPGTAARLHTALGFTQTRGSARRPGSCGPASRGRASRGTAPCRGRPRLCHPAQAGLTTNPCNE